MNVIPKGRTIGVAIFTLLLLVIAPLLASHTWQGDIRAATTATAYESGAREAAVQRARDAQLHSILYRVALNKQTDQLTVLQRKAAAVDKDLAADMARHNRLARTTAQKEAVAARLQQRINYLMREVSRYEVRVSRAKAAYLARQKPVVVTPPVNSSIAAVKAYARGIVGDYQFQFLDQLWMKESGWRWNADNPTSDAYGIPQALPGSKMASAGADWATNPYTQVRWGLGYIKSVYGTCEAAWAHSVQYNWY